tara:strand:- start:9837 stop:12197 length:2361 start_codon:yes stop_codon:yes gene_type:complete
MSKKLNSNKLLIAMVVDVVAVVGLFTSTVSYSEEYLVSSPDEYQEIVKQLQPGDAVILKNRVWNDFEILFEANGTADKPITLQAQTKGSVILSGQSSLRLAGKHLIVSGLVFKNGYTPLSTVINFRADKKRLAYNSRVTEVVIDNYNNPTRFDKDHWIDMHGKNNRFDHNHIIGKRNLGATMIVRLDSKNSQENYHRIDHNYFGPRPILGSNAGETLRIGTSRYSLTNSNTLVENNYFDRTNGEVEIISIKSGKNTIKGNVFYEAKGTLTLRHGNSNLVEDNIFFGNGVDHTGGIRVINADHIVRNNYMEGLTGYRFGSAIAVMNGVINSPINKYHRVKNALIENNTIVNSDHIQLAVGSDAVRQAIPQNSVFRKNLIANESGKDIFSLFDDVSGIKMADNILAEGVPSQFKSGFKGKTLLMKRAENGLLYSEMLYKDKVWVGASRFLTPISREETGVFWYKKPGSDNNFDTGRAIEVSAAEGSLSEAVKAAKVGDILLLAPGKYHVRSLIVVDKPLTIRSQRPATGKGAAGTSVKITFAETTLFEIIEGGDLKLNGLTISGKKAPGSTGNSLIRTSRKSMLTNYRLVVENCHIIDLDKSHTFNFLSVAKNTMADSIELTNSIFENLTGAALQLNVTGAVLYFDKKKNDQWGRYNAEYVTISASEFKNIDGPLINLYRGGADESTYGPHFTLTSSLIDNVGHGKSNNTAASIMLQGVQVSTIKGNRFEHSQPIKINHTVSEPFTKIINNLFLETGTPVVVELNSAEKNTADISNNEVRPLITKNTL